jgi:hypothetical protein
MKADREVARVHQDARPGSKRQQRSPIHTAVRDQRRAGYAAPVFAAVSLRVCREDHLALAGLGRDPAAGASAFLSGSSDGTGSASRALMRASNSRFSFCVPSPVAGPA